MGMYLLVSVNIVRASCAFNFLDVHKIVRVVASSSVSAFDYYLSKWRPLSRYIPRAISLGK